MPKYSKETERTHMERIREILVFQPKATLTVIMDTLEKSPRNPLKLDMGYVNKLRNRIKGEQANRYNNAIVQKELARFEDLVTTLEAQLVKIIADPKATHKDKISATREIRTAYSDLFQKMFDAGIFTRKIGEMDINANISAIIAKVNQDVKVKFKWQDRKSVKPEETPDVEGPRPAEIIKDEEHEGTGKTDSRGDH